MCATKAAQFLTDFLGEADNARHRVLSGNRAGRVNMSVETFTPTGLEFTYGAAQKVKTLVNEEGNERLKLRVFVTGGGCSGFQYGFTFDEDVAEDDTIVEREGVSLVVDPMSFQYLAGAEVDYQEGLEGSRFVIKNPNAATTCGCGSSFSI
jgi:iron-sulfur cluster insertion protein